MTSFISVNHLHKRYGDHVVIEDLSLDIEAGEIVIFQGPSGIGKSTLLRCLTFLEPFQRGSIRVGGVDAQAGMNDVKDRRTVLAMREQLGFVFQFFNLFPHLTCPGEYNAGAGARLEGSAQQARAEALTLLKRVGLAHKAPAYPDTLSGGQQQRVAIARALAMHPKGILFDEPTSSLDPAMKGEIVQVLTDFAKDGLTLLIVTHEPTLVQRIATRLITLGEKCQIH